MYMDERSPSHEIPLTRLESFSDAVIAISITLLAIEFKAPSISVGASFLDTIHALSAYDASLFAFTFSFVSIAVILRNHTRFFRSLERSSSRLFWTNASLLFFVCGIPFATAFLGENPTNVVAIGLYGLIFFAASLAFLIMRLTTANLYQDKMSSKVRTQLVLRSAVGPLLYIFAIATSFVWLPAAYVIFCIALLYYFF